MKKNAFIILLLFVLFFSHAQRSELGALVGTSFYLGDLNSIPFRDAKFAGGLIYRYNFTPRVALKANILFGTITSNDENNHSLGKDLNGNYLWDYKERNLSFTSPISEIAAQLEINFFNLYNVGHKNQITPYLFGGAAFFSFNPQAECDGIYYDLQPIGTEGQGRSRKDEQGVEIQMPNKYKLTGFAVPFGIGFKANIGTFVCIGAEWGLRLTFTNYLDDVGGRYFNFSNLDDLSQDSKRIVEYFADPSNIKHTEDSQRHSTIKADWYSFAGVIITIRIGNEDRICDIKTNVKLKHKKNIKM